MDARDGHRALLAVKVVHTIVWAFFVLCIVAIPVMAWRGEFGCAVGFVGIVLTEVLVLAVNRWRCPLTPVAARFTADRHANFDIFLPERLARHNKVVFGSLYVAGVVYLVLAALFPVARAGARTGVAPAGHVGAGHGLQRWNNDVGMTFVEIPSGSFTMGSRDPAADSHERPPHPVTISRSFFMATKEVTQAQWNAVMGTDPSRFRGDDLPVERVSWHDAMEFIRRLNLEERSMRYRLPTEAEWEYACRADTVDLRDDDLDAVAWYADNSGGTTHPVGRKQANSLGLCDMLGNVYEWCEDWKGDYPSDHVTDPRGPSDGFGRVVRGGSWQVHANRVRPDFRDHLVPDERRADVGFRVVADVRSP